MAVQTDLNGKATEPGRGQGYTLITGASQGLGRAFAVECARRGQNLILVALPRSGLGHVALQVAMRYGVQVASLEMDLTAPGSPEALAAWISDKGLPVSTLINNAGVGYNSRFEHSTLRQNESCILLNNLALVQITRLLLPALVSAARPGNSRHPRAYILNVASLAAAFPMPFMPVYAPSKAFILSFSLALREEMRHTPGHEPGYAPVSVSVLCPNGIRTNRECRDKIAAGGLAARLTCMDADQVAACAVRGMLAGKAVIVPGLINRALMGVSRIVPRTAIYAVVSAFWGRTARQPVLRHNVRSHRWSAMRGVLSRVE